MKVFLVTIDTEDGERYNYVYSKKPSDKKIMEKFYSDHGENYEKRDWRICIGFEMEELEVI